MSNNRTDLVELDVTNDDMKEMLDVNAETAPVAPATKKHVMSRIWAFLLCVAPIALLCVFPTLIFVGQSAAIPYAITGEKTLLDAILAIVKQFMGQEGIASFYEGIQNAPASFDGYSLAFLPLLNNAGFVGKIYSVAFYAIPVAVVLNVIFMIIAIFSGKAAPTMARAIAFVNLFVFGSYAVAILGLGKYYFIDVEYLSMPVYVLGGTLVASLVAYLVYSFIKTRGKGAINFLLLVLTAVFAAAYVYAFFFVDGPRAIITLLFQSTKDSIIPSIAAGTLFKYITLTVFGLIVVSLFFGALRVSTKKGYVFDLIRYIVNFIVAAIVVFFSFTTEGLKDVEFMKWNLFAIVAAGVALVQIVICCIVISVLRKKKKAAKAASEEAVEAPVAEETAPAPVVEETEEETVEAVRYEFPAEKVAEPVEEEVEVVEEAEEEVVEEIVEEVAEEEVVEEPTVAGYDYYNSKSFDPFIASLNDKERQQFTELFILKYRGETKNLPDYEVGGNNKEFFRKIFIYLGQYREVIPSSLLAKMYNFASKK